MRTRRFLAVLALILTASLIFAACGGDDDHEAHDGSSDTTVAAGSASPRTVDINMVDIGYEPTTLEVQAGETVRFVFHNEGATLHDAFIGDVAAQADHAREMRIVTAERRITLSCRESAALRRSS